VSLISNAIPLSNRQHIWLPKHLLVAGSAWISRIIVALVQLASVRFLITGLGLEQYSVFALLMGLGGWYALADFGVGVSVQNHVSESRAKVKPQEGYTLAAGVLAIFFLVMTIGLLYLVSPYIGPLFLKQFAFMDDPEKVKMFATVGALLIGTSIGGIAYKIWYAEQKGYWSNIVPAIASLIGLGGIALVNQSAVPDKLYLSLVTYILPAAALPLIALLYQIVTSAKKVATFDANCFTQIVRRAGHFWGFAIMAAAVLQIDYVVMSQFLKAYDITVYNISTKVFGLAFFIYGAVLAALWPIFAENIANQNWKVVKARTKKYLSLGLAFMALCSLSLIWLMPVAVRILAPYEKLVVPPALIVFLGIYYMVRVWTDTFAMILQSMSDLRPFWIYVPIQAVISVVLQWTLAPIFGLYGILLGLLASFVLTVSWALPFAVKKHYQFHQDFNNDDKTINLYSNL